MNLLTPPHREFRCGISGLIARTRTGILNRWHNDLAIRIVSTHGIREGLT